MGSVSFKTTDIPKNIEYSEFNKIVLFKSVDKPKTIIYEEVVPFRVRFSSIGIPGVAGLVPPIGIAVIGVNNYIL